jgi:hypothetical protein
LLNNQHLAKFTGAPIHSAEDNQASLASFNFNQKEVQNYRRKKLGTNYQQKDLVNTPHLDKRYLDAKADLGRGGCYSCQEFNATE